MKRIFLVLMIAVQVLFIVGCKSAKITDTGVSTDNPQNMNTQEEDFREKDVSPDNSQNINVGEQPSPDKDISGENIPDKEELKNAAKKYILALERYPWGEYMPTQKDSETGRVLCVYQVDSFVAYRVTEFISKASNVQYVELIPELSPPVTHFGKNMVGNHKKLYYSTSEGVVEFSFSDADSLGMLVLLGGQHGGTVYPEVKEHVVESIIKQIQSEIVFDTKDIVSSTTGWQKIDVKTQETADILFECLRNCEMIEDWTGIPNDSLFLINIGNSCVVSFEGAYCEYKETGQFLYITFASEDTKALEEYFNMLTEKYSDN